MLTGRLGRSKGKGRFFEFLIDSGSDYTIIPKSDAQILGIDYEKLKINETEIEAANLTKMHAKEVKLHLQFREDHFTIPVLITREEVDRLLGRKGFFNRYDITFKENLGIVILEKS